VLINVIEHPRSTLRNIARAVSLSDRATHSILGALEADAIIGRHKDGRRNVYTVDLAALRAHRGKGPYTLEELANALFALSGRKPGRALPGPLRGTRPRSGAGNPPPRRKSARPSSSGGKPKARRPAVRGDARSR